MKHKIVAVAKISHTNLFLFLRQTSYHPLQHYEKKFIAQRYVYHKSSSHTCIHCLTAGSFSFSLHKSQVGGKTTGGRESPEEIPPETKLFPQQVPDLSLTLQSIYTD